MDGHTGHTELLASLSTDFVTWILVGFLEKSSVSGISYMSDLVGRVVFGNYRTSICKYLAEIRGHDCSPISSWF